MKQELERFRSEMTKDGLSVEVESSTVWFVSFSGAASTLYEGEKFKLKITFTASYPMESPEVVFVGVPPVHEHIYSNGHICLNILGDDW